MEDDGLVVEVAEEFHSETVDQDVGDEEGCIYTNSFGGCRLIGGVDSCSCGYQSRISKRNACRHCDLAEKVEPDVRQYIVITITRSMTGRIKPMCTYQPVIQDQNAA